MLKETYVANNVGMVQFRDKYKRVRTKSNTKHVTQQGITDI